MRHVKPHSSQLTLRGVDPRVLAEIRRVARQKGISLNKAALSILARGSGVGEPAEPSRRIGPALDRFIGSWTATQAREFSRSLRSLEQVDDELWK
jgi:hypothetical protein